MVKVLVVGDGPAGLSAALFLAKNGHEVVVYGQDDTPMHYAQLRNYLGIRDMHGSEFQRLAHEQITGFGAEVRHERVSEARRDDGGFVVETEAGAERGEYLILAGGKATQRLAAELGAEQADGHVPVDGDQRTSVDRLYAVGRVTRPGRSQAIISAGAGASAALDILAREAGTDVTDWDSAGAD
jgi:thioredoxin reductase (NADPH)